MNLLTAQSNLLRSQLSVITQFLSSSFIITLALWLPVPPSPSSPLLGTSSPRSQTYRGFKNCHWNQRKSVQKRTILSFPEFLCHFFGLFCLCCDLLHPLVQLLFDSLCTVGLDNVHFFGHLGEPGEKTSLSDLHRIGIKILQTFSPSPSSSLGTPSSVVRWSVPVPGSLRSSRWLRWPRNRRVRRWRDPCPGRRPSWEAWWWYADGKKRNGGKW